MLCLPFLPSEVLFMSNDNVRCPDSECKNYLIGNPYESINECYYCKKKKKIIKDNILIMDLRIKKQKENQKSNSTISSNSLKNGTIFKEGKLLIHNKGPVRQLSQED